LKAILLTGQRPGEMANMRFESIRDGWWEMPGAPDPATGWPGTKNGQNHRVWLPEPALNAIRPWQSNCGFAFANGRGKPVNGLPAVMRDICKRLGVADKVTPHDLRRTFASTVTKLGHGRAAMDRILNHKEGGVGSIYDRYGYEAEDKRVMESVAKHVLKSCL